MIKVVCRNLLILILHSIKNSDSLYSVLKIHIYIYIYEALFNQHNYECIIYFVLHGFSVVDVNKSHIKSSLINYLFFI